MSTLSPIPSWLVSDWEKRIALADGESDHMPKIQQSQLRNRLLSRLTEDDFGCLAGHLQHMQCPHGLIICEPNEVLPYFVFPEEGVISIVVLSAEGQMAEGGVVGREGFVPSSVLLGVDRSPHRVEMQIEGHAYKLDTAAFLGIIAKRENIRSVLLKFTQVMIVQTSFTAMTNATHTVEERLARWLLMCHDRSNSDDLHLTHKFMSVMLAVRRASVTTALQMLESRHFIAAERGYVFMRNRAALENFAGDAYGIPEAEYRRLLGPL